MSFLFRIDHLSLQDNSIGVQEGIHWTPPQRSNEYDRQLGPLYRWTDGEVTVVQPNDRANTSALDPYECATVFTQYPDTHHFLAVAFDASSQNVSDEGGWYELGFDHHRQPANPDLVYSYFEIRGHRHHLATPRPAAWIQQLFPTQYHHPNQPGQMVPFTGLTGQLTLLLAIVAFSCPENSLDYVLQNCLRQGEWTPHELGDGREFSSLTLYSVLEFKQYHRTDTSRHGRLRLP